MLIFDRNRPVARLVPAGPVEDYDERTLRLIAKGILTPPKMRRPEGYKLPAPKGPMISQEVMDRVWEEEREDRC